jgi:hypothetical protein
MPTHTNVRSTDEDTNAMARDSSTMTLWLGADDHEHNDELLKQLESIHAQRETLQQRTKENNNTERPALTLAEFQVMLKDLETLYEEIIDLITKIRKL